MRRVAEWEKDGRLHAAVDSSAERMGPIMKATGDKNDWADIANRLKWRRRAKRQEELGLVLGRSPFAEKYAAGCVEDCAICPRDVRGTAKNGRSPAHQEYRGGQGQQAANCARAQLRVAIRWRKPSIVAVLCYSCAQQHTRRMLRFSRTTKTGRRQRPRSGAGGKKQRSLPRRRTQQGARKVRQGKQVGFQAKSPLKNGVAH